MKKKILIAISYVLILALGIVGTLAYLTDRDAKVNVFTAGDVEIELSETFEQGVELMPGKVITKKPTITNTGDNAAYVWLTLSVPAALEGVIEWDEAFAEYEIDNTFIAGYNTYVYLFEDVLDPGAKTADLLTQVSLNKNVDYKDGVYYQVNGGIATKIDYDLDDTVLYVNAYAIQAEEFANVEDAYDAYVGQWGKLNGDHATVVKTADDLATALAAGGSVTLGGDVEVDAANPIVIPADATATLNLNGFDLVGESDQAEAYAVIKNNGTLVIEDTEDTGVIALENAVVSADNSYATDAIMNNGKLTVNGGTIENNLGGASYAIDNNFNAETVINGGKIINNKGTAIRAYSWEVASATYGLRSASTIPSTVVVNGGEITGTYAIRIQNLSTTKACSVDVTVNGGTLIATDPTYNMALYSLCHDGSNINVTLNGGIYFGHVAFGGGNKVNPENVTINKESCTFYGDVFSYNTTVGDIYTAEIVAVNDAETLAEAVTNGDDVILSTDVETTGTVITTNGVTEAYGNKVGVAQYGGVMDGNGNTLTETTSSAYVVVTHGGTIKNLTIVGGGRGIVIYAPTEDVIIDNVVIDGPGYAINTAEHNGQDLIVTNSTIKGWTSLAGLDSVSFTNCLFGENTTKCWQNMGYDQDYDRLVRPYGTATFTECEFEKGFYIDLSALGAGCTVTLTDCVCNGVEITANNYSDYITIELPSGRTLADCVSFK